MDGQQPQGSDRDDGGVIDDEDMLNGHGGDLCQQDSPEGVGDGRIKALEIEFHVLFSGGGVLGDPGDLGSEVALERVKIPLIVDAQAQVCKR